VTQPADTPTTIQARNLSLKLSALIQVLQSRLKHTPGYRVYAFVLGIACIISYAQASAQTPNDPEPTEIASDDSIQLLAVVPVPAVFYTPETGTGLGVGIVHSYRDITDAESVPNSTFIPALIYTQRDQLIGRGILEHYSHDGEYYWTATLAYTRFPDKFYGIGGKTRLIDEELFTEVYGSADFGLSRRIAAATYLGPVLRYEEFAIRDRQKSGSLFQNQISGSARGQIGGAGIRFLHNSRDNQFVPRAGRIIETSFVRHAPALGSTFTFSSSQIRFREYWPLTSRWLVATDSVVEDRSGDVPFRKLALLGGQYLLRGYFLGRYRDSKLAAAQCDLRWMLNARAGLVAFTGVGWVGADWKLLRSNDFHFSHGAGFRYILDEESRINLRVDLGIGKDSSGIYMGVGEAF
jgi:hypothetical protein